MRAAILALAVLFVADSPSTAQEAMEARPGTVMTLIVRPPADLQEGHDPEDDLVLGYAIEAAGGFQLVGSRSGAFTWLAGEEVLFPLTLRVPDRAEAGETRVAVIAFETLDGRSGSVSAVARVSATRELHVELAADRESAARGDPLIFRYSVSNRGNAGDSVALVLETNGGPAPTSVPQAIWLAPFEQRRGEFAYTVPADAKPGTQGYVRLTARAGDAISADFATFGVTPDRGMFPDFVHIPTTVFFGSTLTSFDGSRQTQPVVAFSGQGSLSPGTEVLFSYRHVPSGGSVYAFRGLLSGPRLLVGVRRPEWEAVGGDIDVRASELLGYQLQGRGIMAGWRPGAAAIQGLAARPTGLDGSTVAGHVLGAEAGLDLSGIRAGVIATSTERSDPAGLPESAVRAALASAEGSAGRHWLRLDAGHMAVRNDRTGQAVAGLALDARYAFRSGPADVDFRYRTLPDLASDPRLPPREVRAVGTARVSARVSAVATVYDEAGPQSLWLDGSRVRGTRAGLRWGGNAWTLGLTGEDRTTRGTISGHRRTGKLEATLRTGRFTLDGSVGLGVSSVGDITELAELYRVGATWLGRRGMASLHMTVTDDILQPTATLLDAYGVLQVAPSIELYGSATTYAILQAEGFAPRSISDGLTVRTGARFRVLADTYVYSGVERLASGGLDDARWRLSVGVQKGLPLPLPVRRSAPASGIVYEDVDGDGRRGTDEPFLDGVALRMGFEQTISRAGGEFEFRDAEPGRIIVDMRSLGPDYVPLPDLPVRPGERIEIGVYRAGGLRIVAYLDANGDGMWDDTELPANGVTLSLGRGANPWLLSTGPDGTAVLSSIVPGTYRIEVDGQSLPPRARAPEAVSVEVRGGDIREIVIAIPLSRIRFTSFGEGAELCEESTATCDD